MVDDVLSGVTLLAGAATAAAVMLVASRSAPPWRQNVRWSWAIAAGVLVSSGIGDQWPQWPPLEDRARYLTVLVPAIAVLETLVARTRSAATAWTLRLCLAAIVAPTLLYETTYLVSHDGRPAEWSPAHAVAIFAGLTVLLGATWALVDRLQARTSSAAVQGIMLLDAVVAAVTVMMSGYLRGGWLGLNLAAAIAGAVAASCLTPTRVRGSVAMSVVGVFAVVLLGHFFGTLSAGLAGCLLLAPLLAWIAELPALRTLTPLARGALRLACVVVPLVIVLVVAQRRFAAAAGPRLRPPPKPTVAFRS